MSAKTGVLPISKMSLSHYFDNYETYLGPLRDTPIKLLELGIAEGDSLAHWENWFPRAEITGLDVNPCERAYQSDRVETYQGEQQDTMLLDRIARERAPDGFDVIIDDASHVGQLTRISFWHLFNNHLKPDGLFFIEDWGTGYWSSYPDGRPPRNSPVDFGLHQRVLNRLQKSSSVQKVMPLRKLVSKLRWELVTKRIQSHDYGMVGFVKSLVDEVGVPDITQPALGRGPERASKFSRLSFTHGLAIVQKAK